MRRFLVLAVLAAAPLAAAASALDDEMNALSKASGCALCHAPRPRTGDAVPPPGPAWSDIASRYRGRPDAEQKLVRTIMSGTGPANRHWAGKTSAVVMPGSEVEITEPDATRLVRWILRRP